MLDFVVNVTLNPDSTPVDSVLDETNYQFIGVSDAFECRSQETTSTPEFICTLGV